MASIAVDHTTTPRIGALHGLRRVGLVVAGIAVFWALWEGYRWFGETVGITWPFTVDATNMPHIHDMLHALTEPLQPGGPPLIQLEWHWALFTAKEAFLGCVLGVVVGLGTKGVTPWVSVSVIAAYLTFFPVAMNTLRGLLSPKPRDLELMRSYAADRRSMLWKLRMPASLPFVFSALKISATASVIGAIIGETPASIQDGLGGAIVNFNQYYSTGPERLWATNIVCAALGLIFFTAVVIAERLVLRRAPEHVA